MHLLMATTPYHLVFWHQMESMIDDQLIYGFTILVIIDIFTGIARGLRSKKTSERTNSTRGIVGLGKHLIIVLIVITAYPYLTTLGFGSFAQLIVLTFAYQYLVSIVENLYQMNIQVWWAQVMINELARILNVAKAQIDYDSRDFDLTGKYRGKEKQSESKTQNH